MIAAFLAVRGWLPENPIYTELPIFSWYLPLDLIIPAAGEEVLFRIAPLILAMNRWGTRWPTLIVLAISSALFGFVHGGAGFILIQGVGGFLYGLLFMKFSESGAKYVRASALVILIHIAFNLLYILTLAAYGETTW
jgi:membrane protease YdiL (CAAX protease family)